MTGGELGFGAFAAEFVGAYWETVRSGAFPMPPDEAVRETLEELLAAVSHEVDIDSSSDRREALYTIHMTGGRGDWWEFRFLKASPGWRLVGCAAGSDDPARPHDLFDAVYAPYFEPFLLHVTEVANERSGV